MLCLVERETGHFEFEVQSLREYFAALYIFDNAPPRGKGNSRDDCLDALLERPYWSNVCRFLVGMFSSVEVRGIRHNLRELSAKPLLRAHPLLRSIATLLLDDRAFQGQPDGPIQEIVDFILDGPGAVLAEDGLLEASGTPLTLTGGAGRTQAVRHLQGRLAEDNPSSLRAVLAKSLHRHAQPDDRIPAWWWAAFSRTEPWLQTATDLVALGGLNATQTAKLADALPHMHARTNWITELLAKGGYDGDANSVLNACVTDINDGAAELVDPPSPTTPLGRLLECAAICSRQGQQPRSATVEQPRGTRTRMRQRNGRKLITEAVTLADALRLSPNPVEGDLEWSRRLTKVAQFWGDGWVLRQAVAAVPPGVDLSIITSHVRDNALLAGITETETQARARKGDAAWWRQRMRTSGNGQDHRHGLFSLLTIAHTNVVIELADDLNTAAGQLEIKHVRMLEKAMKTFGRRSSGTALVIQDQLRRNLVSYSPRVLWLLRAVVSKSSLEQVDKKISADYRELLETGMGDMRSLLHIAGAEKTVKIETLRGARDVLPAGGWASDVKLGVVQATKAAEILGTPADWPADVVQRGVEHFATRMATVEPISALAQRNKWFQEIN